MDRDVLGSEPFFRSVGKILRKLGEMLYLRDDGVE